MERYIFFDPDRIPSGLHVIGVPTPNGFLWVEITVAEYQAAVAEVAVARRWQHTPPRSWPIARQASGELVRDAVEFAER